MGVGDTLALTPGWQVIYLLIHLLNLFLGSFFTLIYFKQDFNPSIILGVLTCPKPETEKKEEGVEGSYHHCFHLSRLSLPALSFCKEEGREAPSVFVTPVLANVWEDLLRQFALNSWLNAWHVVTIITSWCYPHLRGSPSQEGKGGTVFLAFWVSSCLCRLLTGSDSWLWLI